MSWIGSSLDSGVLRCSQDMDLNLLPLVFSLIFTVSSRLLHLYSTNDKTSRLKMKSFSTVRDTQRGTQLHGEEKEEGGDRGNLVEIKESPKGKRAVKPVISLPSKNGY